MENNGEPTVVATQVSNDTVIVTSQEEKIDQYLDKLVASYNPAEQVRTAVLESVTRSVDLDQAAIDNNAANAQTSLQAAMTINGLIQKYINMNDIIGLVVQSIQNNINTDYKLSYNNFGEKKPAKTILRRAQAVIEDFNRQIDIESFIVDSIIGTYCEGTYVTMLHKSQNNWAVSNLPLGVAEMSGYKDNSLPIVLINIDELKNALNKTMIKNGRDYLFYKNVGEEIKACYPAEVYEAYTKRHKYAALDTRYTGVSTINCYGRKYGLSPIFRSLSSMIALRSFQDADVACAKATGKKIIHQIMRKEILGPTGTNRGIDLTLHAHNELVGAWRNPTVVYTSIPAVEKIVYVEPTSNNQSNKIGEYRNAALTSLGISFLANNDGKLTAASANISIQQLMRQINTISRSVEGVLENFYRTVLADANIDVTYAPSVKIIDSEMLSMDLRIELAKALYNVFGASRETAMGVIGISVTDERAKREAENEEGLSDIFTPYPTSYVISGDNSGGRPKSSDDPDKQQEDEARNQNGGDGA